MSFDCTNVEELSHFCVLYRCIREDELLSGQVYICTSKYIHIAQTLILTQLT